MEEAQRPIAEKAAKRSRAQQIGFIYAPSAKTRVMIPEYRVPGTQYPVTRLSSMMHERSNELTWLAITAGKLGRY